jgi:hypothetical protein
MTSWECYENKWFYMKYIGKYLSGKNFWPMGVIQKWLFWKNMVLVDYIGIFFTCGNTFGHMLYAIDVNVNAHYIFYHENTATIVKIYYKF